MRTVRCIIVIVQQLYVNGGIKARSSSPMSTANNFKGGNRTINGADFDVMSP